MSTVTAKARELSETQAANAVSVKFPPASVNGRALIRDTGSAPVEELPLGEIIDIGVHRAEVDLHWQGMEPAQANRDDDRLLNARQVAAKLGVSERFIRDHTTRRSPKIPAVKLGKLIRYRRADVDVFMAELGTLPPSRRPRFGV